MLLAAEDGALETAAASFAAPVRRHLDRLRDLLVFATARAHRLELLHRDAHFDALEKVTSEQMQGNELVLLDGLRTPMAAFGGSFAGISAIDLGAHAARALFEKTGVDPAEVDHTVVGNALQTSPDAIYGARHVALKAGVPKEVPALTVNRLCGSGIQSILSGAHLILAGEAETVLVGGMENMSQAPHCIWGARQGLRLGEGQLQDLLMLLESAIGRGRRRMRAARPRGHGRPRPGLHPAVLGGPRDGR